VVSGNSVIGTRIQWCLVASPGPPMSPHHDRVGRGAHTVEVASTSGVDASLRVLLRDSVRLGPAITDLLRIANCLLLETLPAFTIA
jgi:hypothetical protein